MIRNTWLWFHILGGLYLTKLFQLWFSDHLSVLLVLTVAVLWEVYEYIGDDVEKIYGSKKRFYKDALQDIAGALIAAIGVVL